MGVRYYDKENMSNLDKCEASNLLPSSAASSSSSTTRTTTTTTTSSINSTQTTNHLSNGINTNLRKIGSLREIVGNCKEVRIEDNIHNLRIVGNNNRIRIVLNVGDITVVGNNTRLKIEINHGRIKYTGNNGRISLGKKSTEQLVDYSGCNGVLKVKNSKKSSPANANDDDDEMHDSSITGIGCFYEKLNDSKKQKYASFSGSPSSVSEVFKCHNKFVCNRSMPNITTKPFHSDKVSSEQNETLPKNILPNFGNIVIANSSNIYISPYAYTY